jgi:hypothetical protein
MLLSVAVLASSTAVAQESVLVASFGLGVYDMNLNNLSMSVPPTLGQYLFVADPNNPHLAYATGNGNYISVFDLTMGREINRIYGACGFSYAAFTTDNKYLLVADCTGPTLDIVDLARQTVFRKVNLSRGLRASAHYASYGSLVVVGNKAYVTAYYTYGATGTVALVDLKTYEVRSILLPSSGSFDGYEAPNAAVTPDQKYVIVAQYANNCPTNCGPYLHFIDTASNRVVRSLPQTIDPEGILVTPVNNPGSVYGYLLGLDNNTGNPSAIIIDLNPGSQTFGQQVGSEVDLGLAGFDTACAAINSAGTRLVVGGYPLGGTGNNLVELDTGLMLTNPTAAIVAQTTVGGPSGAYVVSIANVSLTPPSPPTVASVSAPLITNDSPNTITVTGTNFQPGARVRVGTMPPVAADVLSATTLTAVVPQNAPGRANLDVLVTNPGLSNPANQQYQSGVLPASLTIKLNPVFQPVNRFAAYSFGGLPPAVYDPTLGSMIMDNSSTVWATRGITFNADGQTIYGLYFGSQEQVIAWDSTTLSVVAQITLFNVFGQATGPSALAASVNPQTGRPVIVVPVRTFIIHPRAYDVALEVIDSDSSSNTYNTVLGTIPTGQNFTDNAFAYGCALTPDGHYAYLSYRHTNPATSLPIFSIAIFDMLARSFVTSIDASVLGIAPNIYQTDMQVTSDGRSLLVKGNSANLYAGPVAVLDISQPTNPRLVTTINGTPPATVGGTPAFNFSTYQAVGNRLFAFDYVTSTVVAFNFDRTASDFTQLATYSIPATTSGVYGLYDKGTTTVTPDGALVYVTNPNSDSITVLDAIKLAAGQDPFITNIGAFPGAFQVAVSQTTLPNAPVTSSQAVQSTGTVPSSGPSERPAAVAPQRTSDRRKSPQNTSEGWRKDQVK